MGSWYYLKIAKHLDQDQQQAMKNGKPFIGMTSEEATLAMMLTLLSGVRLLIKSLRSSLSFGMFIHTHYFLNFFISKRRITAINLRSFLPLTLTPLPTGGGKFSLT
ncbi:hypothetical protein THII_3065 [Thioploca ingrica]|uniref:Uncharacterized protein n=1 Tax=Thioploca ingrica TaxID=40754 RepID=A0A090AMX3_9GAMM|nr:hypothetical protein THII_3065 [Thioploca ingrica]